MTDPPSLPRLEKGFRILGEQRRKLAVRYAEAYLAGASIREIADKSGRSFAFVRALLTEDAGIVLRQMPCPSGRERRDLADRFAAEYRAGAIIQEIAERSGWSYGFVHTLLTEDAGIVLRRGPRGKESRDLADRFAAEYRAGATLQEIAKKSGRSYTFVRNLLRKDRGMVLRGRGRVRKEPRELAE